MHEHQRSRLLKLFFKIKTNYTIDQESLYLSISVYIYNVKQNYT